VAESDGITGISLDGVRKLIEDKGPAPGGSQ
jgi:hypothetical protein